MIQSFRCAKTEKLWQGQRVKAFDAIQTIAERRLAILDAATTLLDLKALPSNRLEALKGKRKGQHSIRINDQWRVCFRWETPHAYEVEIVDYH